MNSNNNKWQWGKNLFSDPRELGSVSVPVYTGAPEVPAEHILPGPIDKSSLKPLSINDSETILSSGTYSYLGNKTTLFPDESIQIVFPQLKTFVLPVEPSLSYAPELKTWKKVGNQIIPDLTYKLILGGIPVEGEFAYNVVNGRHQIDLPSINSPVEKTIEAFEPIYRNAEENILVFSIDQFPLLSIQIVQALTGPIRIDKKRGFIYAPALGNEAVASIDITYKASPLLVYVPKDYSFDLATLSTPELQTNSVISLINKTSL